LTTFGVEVAYFNANQGGSTGVAVPRAPLSKIPRKHPHDPSKTKFARYISLGEGSVKLNVESGNIKTPDSNNYLVTAISSSGDAWLVIPTEQLRLFLRIRIFSRWAEAGRGEKYDV